MSVLKRVSRALVALSVAATVAISGVAPAAAITDGRNVSPGVQSNSMVRLNIGEMSCTGTLITPEWVLAARHCAPEGKTVGEAVIGGFIWGEYKGIAEARLHPTADLAVIRLHSPSGATTANLHGTHLQAGSRGPVTGWGGWNHANQMIIGQQADAHVVRRISNLDSPDRSAQLLEAEIYRGRLLPGDSGGPLWVNGQVAGVLSMSTATDRPSYDGTMGWYVPVAEHLDWISRQTGKAVPPVSGQPSPLVDASRAPSMIPAPRIQNIPATGNLVIDGTVRSWAVGSS